VAVKLYCPEKMSSCGMENEKHQGHETVGHRVWMTGEYKILSKEEVQELKKFWDSLE
jgi:hypothetical protein